MNVLLVFIGGGIGSVLRYLIGQWIHKGQTHFPTATFLANVLAALVIAAVIFMLSKSNQLSERWVLFLTTGFCGGLSTFSTFSLETFELIRTDQMIWAAANIVFNVVVCISLVAALYRLSA